jgi:hypothetical protein
VEDALPTGIQGHVDGPVGAKPRDSADELDCVALEVSAHRIRHRLDHFGRAGSELCDRRLRIECQTQPVHLPSTETGDVQGRLTQCLTWDYGVSDGCSAGRRGALHDGNPLAEVRRLRRGLLTGRPGADYHHVEAIFRRHPNLQNVRAGCSTVTIGKRRRKRAFPLLGGEDRDAPGVETRMRVREFGAG